MNTSKSEELYKRAVRVIPGGVNSPVRAFNAVGGKPIFIEKAKGAYIWDSNGNKYTDYIGSWGPMILGHNHNDVLREVTKQLKKGMSFGAAAQPEVEMAELITELCPHIEMIRMVNSGTEAVMSAIRAARGYTGKNKIIKFEGCYHGHSDGLLVKAGSGAMTGGVPNSSGVPKGCVEDTLLAEYNSLESVEKLFDIYPNQIACIIVEPVAANMGVVLPEDGFLKGLRNLCTKNNALLIFDEVITGFRLKIDGGAGYFEVTPDLVTYGKIIGGGMPVGAYGGKREIMEVVAPLGSVYQAGTLSGNPVAMRAGIEQIKILANNPQYYIRLENLGSRLRKGFNNVINKYGLKCRVSGISSLSCLYFCSDIVNNYEQAKAADETLFAKYFNFMLGRGNYFGASQYEAIFLSIAHTNEDIDKTIRDFKEFAVSFCRNFGNGNN